MSLESFNKYSLSAEEIGARLRGGHLVVDLDFDEWLPEIAKAASARHWTQVGVAVRAIRWLQACGVSTVLDVGSGAGKFCVVGALSSDIAFTGVEQREHFASAACTLAARFDVTDRANFVHGDMDAVDFRLFDALYFYNPFGENVFSPGERIDDAIELGLPRFRRDTAKAEYLLERMPVGSHLVTYNSYGGGVPDSFDLVRSKTAGVGMLRLWSKARAKDQGGFWLELDDATTWTKRVDD